MKIIKKIANAILSIIKDDTPKLHSVDAIEISNETESNISKDNKL